MANIREIHSRMKSIKDIMKITNAMYLISSSKLKKARKSLLATQPYFEGLQSTIHDILIRTPHMHQVFFERREEIKPGFRKEGYIVITADKGLAGAYNHNVIKRAEEEMQKSKKNFLFVIGQVGRQYFLRKGVEIECEFLYTAQNPTLYRAQLISETIIEMFEKGELDDVYVIFNKMITPMKSEVQFRRILPLERRKFDRRKEGYQHAIFEPSPEEVMNKLVPNYLKGYIFGVLVEAFSSEQNARMTAMEAATSSAKDMLRELDLQYNRARQASITQEITEIVSGAKSLKK
ncbi:F-type H+-transporting ATPase subunit gamma [Mobilisporobacter senegalensis]|uniref:ATP synthase gamma chain n=1 Tax=Mobilisporobacter senegalensis TaxID=1329262 RepID=A0A3N1XWV5_9FIRM|nr:ATP synthase F1 subunit gamma [Mobilisporobacter senegalensis]ROR30681.1 F-type H+-transporting ATPase subunit gamma [Mobilisporobacter senegalensis]